MKSISDALYHDTIIIMDKSTVNATKCLPCCVNCHPTSGKEITQVAASGIFIERPLQGLLTTNSLDAASVSE